MRLNPKPEFDRSTALTLAYCSMLAYDDTHGTLGAAFTAYPEITLVSIAPNGWAKELRVDGQQVIACRGTDGAADYLLDGRAELVSAPGMLAGRWHAGFKDRSSKLHDWAAYRLRPGQPMWFTGHSLGGAVATNLRRLLTRIDGPPVYTFGEPRGRDAIAVADYPHLHFRVIDDMDIVPHVPAWSLWTWPLHWTPEYRHVGRAWVIDGDTIAERSWADQISHFAWQCQQGIIQTLRETLSEHSIARYVAALEMMPAIPDDGSPGCRLNLERKRHRQAPGK